MSTIRSLASGNLRRLARIILYGSHDQKPISSPLSDTSVSTNGDCFSAHQRMQSSDADQGTTCTGKHSKTRANKFQPPAPLPHPQPIFPSWARWAFGSIMSLILPFWKSKSGKLRTLEDEVEQVAEVVETAAEVVEMVANAVETLSSEVAKKLPDDGKLKDAVLLIESASKAAAKDAQLTIEFIHKVDELKQEVETLVEPVIPDRQKHVLKPTHRS